MREKKEQKVADKFNEFVSEKNKKVQARLDDIFKDDVKFNPDKQENFTQTFYERFDVDDGFVTEQNEIAALKSLRFSDIVNNELLGEYDENGAYRISEPILAELVSLEKKIDAQTPNGLEARAFVGNKVFYFNLTPPKSMGKGQARTVLQLREQVSRVGGYYVDTITTNLATYEFEDDKYFYDRAKEVFHYKPYKSDADAPTQAMPDEMAARFKFILAMQNSGVNLLENLEEAYFDKRLQLLNDTPALAFIITEFNARKKKLDKFLKNAKYKFLCYNQLLTMIMEEYMDKISKSNCWLLLQNAAMKYYELCAEVEKRMRLDPKAKQAQANIISEISENGKKTGKEKKAKFAKFVTPVGRDHIKPKAQKKEKEQAEKRAKTNEKNGSYYDPFNPEYRERQEKEPTTEPPKVETHEREDEDKSDQDDKRKRREREHRDGELREDGAAKERAHNQDSGHRQTGDNSSGAYNSRTSGQEQGYNRL